MTVKKKVGKPPLYDEKSKKMIVMVPYSITKAQVDTLRNKYLYPVIRKYLDEINEDTSEIQEKMTEPDEIGKEDLSSLREKAQKEYEEMQMDRNIFKIT